MADREDGGMPDPRRSRRGALVRSDLPATFTPETLRELDMWTLRRLSQRGNGVLSADDQRDFDEALRVVMQAPTGRLQQSLRRFDRDRADALDPELRRSYLRTRARLEAQAGRARSSFPQLSTELEATPPESSEPPDGETAEADEGTDDMSLASFESEIEEASDSLVLLERIASIEQQQLEHHRAQALRDVRGVYFAVVVSVAVIVSGVAPLVAAEPSQRLLILGWTALVCLTAGLVYAAVRAAQSHRSDPD
jgi:hypothetical protein